jgi:hypothetical protein
MEISVVWDISPCSLLKVSQHFGDCACYLFHAGFFLGLLVNPEDGGDMFL